ncbi:MAG TPA: cytochrome c3 family protein, partial [Anaerolineae bacterium]
GTNPVPADHAGRAVDTCLACHKAGTAAASTPAAASTAAAPATTAAAPAAAAGGPPAIPHPIAGRETLCLTCHGPTGTNPVPADHAGRTVDTCQACHKPAG